MDDGVVYKPMLALLMFDTMSTVSVMVSLYSKLKIFLNLGQFQCLNAKQGQIKKSTFINLVQQPQ